MSPGVQFYLSPDTIHRVSRSASLVRVHKRMFLKFRAGSHFVSNRPIWLAEAADAVIARSPTTQRIAGSRHRRSASFTSSYPAKHRNTDWHSKPAPG
jgi:hypothetical protein